MTWTDNPPCSGLGHLFFPPHGETTRGAESREREAKQICATCPVIDTCRQEGRKGHEAGIWGGENDLERAIAGYPPLYQPRRVQDAIRKAREAGIVIPNYRKPGKPLHPCGTNAAYRRHLRDHEEPCVPCREANKLYQAQRRERYAARTA